MDFKALIHNSESSCPQSMLRCILQQKKPSCINAKGNPHSPGRTVCSDNGISYQLYWTGMRISLALFLRRPLPQILIFTNSATPSWRANCPARSRYRYGRLARLTSCRLRRWQISDARRHSLSFLVRSGTILPVWFRGRRAYSVAMAGAPFSSHRLREWNIEGCRQYPLQSFLATAVRFTLGRY
jgi:hypothetical protein